MNKNIRANSSKDGSYNKLVSGLLPNTTYYFQAYALTKSGTLLKGETKSFITPANAPWTLENTMLDSANEKYAFLFQSDRKFYTKDNPPLGYKTYSEARQHMVSVTVPIWVLSGGKRRPSTRSLFVNRKLAENVKAVFNDIYALDIKFPVMYLHGFSYRKVRGPGLDRSRILSHHSFGSAIRCQQAV